MHGFNFAVALSMAWHCRTEKYIYVMCLCVVCVFVCVCELLWHVLLLMYLDTPERVRKCVMSKVLPKKYYYHFHTCRLQCRSLPSWPRTLTLYILIQSGNFRGEDVEMILVFGTFSLYFYDKRQTRQIENVPMPQFLLSKTLISSAHPTKNLIFSS